MECHNIEAITCKNDLDRLLQSLEGTKENYLVRNCISQIEIGHREVQTYFSDVLYASDIDTMYLFTKNSELERKTWYNNLLKSNLYFHQIDLLKDSKNPKSFEKPIWFATNKKQVERALDDSKEKGFTTGIYYPKMSGDIQLQMTVEDQEEETFERAKVKGVIDLLDKLIVFIETKENKNTMYRQIFSMLWDKEFTVDVDWGFELPYFDNPKVYEKSEF